MNDDIERILLTEEEIRAAVEGLARRLEADLAGLELTVVVVLKGSFVFAGDLVRRLPLPLELTFVSASSYGAGTEPADLELAMLPEGAELAGRHLLVVDDILDSGRTLQGLVRALAGRGAAEVRTCVLLDKPARRIVDVRADYRCFEVGDEFVVGYGLDFANRYRNLPYVGVLKPAVLERGTEAAGGAP